jgi:hypothetical protein
MFNRSAMAAALALLLIALVVWTLGRMVPRSVQPAGTSSAPATKNFGDPSAAPGSPPANVNLERSTLADALNLPTGDIRGDLRIVAGIIETFRTNFLQSGNPVGTNAEITSALTGRNPLRLSLIPRNHPAINQAGELCDRWGTPFFFHAESATRMEIRSAGPDRKMWSDDDVVLSP